jgi:hypothetical protein
MWYGLDGEEVMYFDSIYQQASNVGWRKGEGCCALKSSEAQEYSYCCSSPADWAVIKFSRSLLTLMRPAYCNWTPIQDYAAS